MTTAGSSSWRVAAGAGAAGVTFTGAELMSQAIRLGMLQKHARHYFANNEVYRIAEWLRAKGWHVSFLEASCA